MVCFKTTQNVVVLSILSIIACVCPFLQNETTTTHKPEREVLKQMANQDEEALHPKNIQDFIPDRNIAASSEQQRKLPRYIFGHSTGHTGTFTAHKEIQDDKECPFTTVGRKELMVKNEKKWPCDERLCERVRTELIPIADRQARQAKRASLNFTNDFDVVIVDMGHFHNHGRVLECLASILQDDVMFVRLRRDRHQIAFSFARTHGHVTSCLNVTLAHPSVSICPASSDAEFTGPPNLPIANDSVWLHLSPFQRFLWYADEMEHRWHTLQSQYPNSLYKEITWSTSTDLKDGISQLRADLGCKVQDRDVVHANGHVKHNAMTRNCTDLVLQDLSYIRAMRYDAKTKEILFGHPQRVYGEECIESRQGLLEVIESLNHEYSSSES